MIPDFSKKTIETLAQRAAFKCSNPDCRVNTVGPNSDPNKSTRIGEAAHIYGARVGSKRYNSKMTDSTRAEITNSIWLCRNCHKIIDSDENKYLEDILFTWREKHEEYVASTLGTKTDLMAYELHMVKFKDFDNYGHLVKRIVLDKPVGWEYRLTAELMRSINAPLFRKLADLKSGLYLKTSIAIEPDKAYQWVHGRITELSKIVPPIVGVLEQLNRSWGKPGEHGDAQEILHVTLLIRDYLQHIIDFEERIHFAILPPDYQRLVNLLKNLIGPQAEKLSCIPSDLDNIVSYIENPNEDDPNKFKKEFVFELPDYWEKEMYRELNKLRPELNNGESSTYGNGCLVGVVIIIVLIILMI